MLNIRKFQNAVLYFATHCNDGTLGKKKLAKLLYFLDFDYFKKHYEPVTGATYRHLRMGPVPDCLWAQIDEMVEKGLIKIEPVDLGLPNKLSLITPLKKINLSVFNEREISELERVSDRWRKTSGEEMAKISHEEVTYAITEMNEEIPYQLALHRQEIN